MVLKNKFRNAFIQMYGIILINYYFSGLPKLPNSDAFTYRRAIATENVYCFSSKWGDPRGNSHRITTALL